MCSRVIEYQPANAGLSVPIFFHSKKSPEGGVGSSIRAVSGEHEAGELRVGHNWREPPRAGHGPSAGHRPPGDLPRGSFEGSDRAAERPSSSLRRVAIGVRHRPDPGAHVGGAMPRSHVASPRGPTAVHDAQCERRMVPGGTHRSDSARHSLRRGPGGATTQSAVRPAALVGSLCVPNI